MKPRHRTLAIKSALGVGLVLGITVGIISLPRNIEGVYSAGELYQCLCDGSHYIRFHDGLVAHYSTNHEPANLIGRYEVGADGSVTVYMTAFRRGDLEKKIFTLGQPRVGFAIATTSEENQSCLLVRLPDTGALADLIARQDVTQVTIPDETKIVTTFYNSSLAVARQETKPIKKRSAKAGGG